MFEFIRQLFHRPILALELLGASFFINVLGLASSIYVMQVLNRYVSHGIDATLLTLSAGVILAIAMEYMFRQLRMRLGQGIHTHPNVQLATNIFTVITGARAAALEQVSPDLRREAASNLAIIQQTYTPTNLVAILDLPFTLLALAALLMLNPTIAMIAASFLGALLLISLVSHARLRKPMEELAIAMSRSGALAGTALREVETVRAFGAAGPMRRLWWKHQIDTTNLQHQVHYRQMRLQSISQAMGALMSVGIIATGAKMAVNGQMDMGVMIGVNILAGRALAPVIRFAQIGGMLAKARHALAMLKRFGQIPMEPMRGAAIRAYQGRLELQDLSFAYPGATTPLFESLNLMLEPGHSLSVIGGNGAGKTTLARILTGIYEPTRGQVLVDGSNLRQLLPEWWRRQLVYLPQEPGFMDGTIRENLMACNAGLDEAGLNRVVKLAGLERFLSEHPEGFDAKLMGGGINLALGQRRRLALARALASNGRLVIFDEPTEGLDAAGRAAAFQALGALSQEGRTVVVFSHDPTLVRGAAMTLDLDAKPTPRLIHNHPPDTKPSSATAGGDAS
ncbi:MAG: ATP-binding cassette domain-containing protein [Magnetococcales bacterium]|nr:ATP-binding cassette domain-containing protein [Magnetococcales bacterium]